MDWLMLLAAVALGGPGSSPIVEDDQRHELTWSVSAAMGATRDWGSSSRIYEWTNGPDGRTLWVGLVFENECYIGSTFVKDEQEWTPITAHCG